MSLLDQASLVVTPNAYNVSKLYSVIPNTNLGDMTVSRALSATRVNSAKFIEIARTNLALQSDGNLSTYGTFANVTNASSSFDSFVNAIQFTNTLLSYAYKAISTTAQTYTISVFIKMDDNSVPILSALQSTGNLCLVIGGVIASSNLTTVSYGNNVYRLSATEPSTGANVNNGVIRYNTQVLKSFKITGIQLEEGSVATEYIPTTTSIRTKFAGITQDGGFGANIPRIDYTGGGCPSILVEPARTNLVLYSEEFDNASWIKTNTTATANTTTAPDNTSTADTITGIGLIGLRLIQTNSISFTTATSYSLSVFAKKSTNDFIQLIASNFVGGMYANFNLNTGVVGTLGTTTGTNPTSSITNYGSGWYRCTMNFTTTATISQVGSIGIVTSASASRAESNTLTTSVFLWGAQLEAGEYSTSYIPTVTGTVPRAADVISKTGISSLIGQTEGTLFFDGIVNNIQNATSNILNTNKNPSTISSIALTKIKATNKIRFEQFLGDGTLNNIPLLSTNSFANGTRTKVAVRYKSGDFAMYINGIQEATSASTYTNIGVKSELFLNDSVTIFAFQESVSFNSAILWKTALTDDQCILLTGASFSTYPEMANALIYTIQ